MRIRRARDADAGAISTLVVPLVEKYIAYPFEPRAVARLLDSMTEEAIAGNLRGDFRYHVAVQDGEIIGVVATRGDSHLYHVFVADKARRQGIATALWKVARDASHGAGHEGAFTVNASSYAEGFYRKLGFRRIRTAQENGIASVEMRLDG